MALHQRTPPQIIIIWLWLRTAAAANSYTTSSISIINHNKKVAPFRALSCPHPYSRRPLQLLLRVCSLELVIHQTIMSLLLLLVLVGIIVIQWQVRALFHQCFMAHLEEPIIIILQQIQQRMRIYHLFSSSSMLLWLSSRILCNKVVEQAP
jgi:hypothetical protein